MVPESRVEESVFLSWDRFKLVPTRQLASCIQQQPRKRQSSAKKAGAFIPMLLCTSSSGLATKASLTQQTRTCQPSNMAVRDLTLRTFHSTWMLPGRSILLCLGKEKPILWPVNSPALIPNMSCWRPSQVAPTILLCQPLLHRKVPHAKGFCLWLGCRFFFLPRMTWMVFCGSFSPNSTSLYVLIVIS